MANKRDILVPEGFYHIYNRANADDHLFTEDVEYYLFLKKYFNYSNLIFSTFGYCLLKNHFHFLVQVLPESKLNQHIGLFGDDKSRSNFMAQHLGNFFNWYATYFNKKHFRKGSLFMHTFHRKPISDHIYLIRVLCYIHANPIKAGLCEKFEDWNYSSFKEYIYKPDQIPAQNRAQTLEWFDGIENFKETHIQYIKSK